MTADVTIYARTVCKLCDQVKIKLGQAGIEFETVNLDLPEHAEARSYVENVLRARSVPVTVSDGFPPIFGYQPEKIKDLIKQLGSRAADARAAISDDGDLTKNEE